MSKLVVKDENFYTVQGWMRNRLGLRGNALDTYAIIYGFSQVSHQEFTASINYLCEWLGVSRPTVINTLKTLVDEGFLTKESTEINGVTYNRYTAVVPDFTGGKEILLPQSKNFTGDSQEILPNNINNTTEDKETKKDKSFLGEQAPLPEKPLSKQEIIASVYEDPSNVCIIEALRKYQNWFDDTHIGYQGNTVAKWAKILRDNAGEDLELAFAIVDQSIKRGWKSLYPLKKQPKRDAIIKPVTGKTVKTF